MTELEPKLPLVRYYLEGWRTGWLAESNGFSSVVIPIGPKGQTRRKVKIPSDDVEIIIENAAK